MLPLLAGIAIGAGAVVAINNREELKEKIANGAKVVQETASKAKDSVVEKAKSVTSKKETSIKTTKQKDE